MIYFTLYCLLVIKELLEKFGGFQFGTTIEFGTSMGPAAIAPPAPLPAALLCFALLFQIILCAYADDLITCGSVLKLQNAADNIRLHSHEVKYGSGSGQQSVTGMAHSDDVNSHWQILGCKWRRKRYRRSTIYMEKFNKKGKAERE